MKGLGFIIVFFYFTPIFFEMEEHFFELLVGREWKGSKQSNKGSDCALHKICENTGK